MDDPDKTYHIYFKNGSKISFTNFFQFYLYKENTPEDKIEKFTVEEVWVDVQKQFMKMLEEKRKSGELKHE